MPIANELFLVQLIQKLNILCRVDNFMKIPSSIKLVIWEYGLNIIRKYAFMFR